MSHRIWATPVILVIGLMIAAVISAQETEPAPQPDQKAQAEEPVAEQPLTALFSGEITVTAQKREQMLQDVGIAVTAMSAAQIEALGLVNTVDITGQMPNVEVMSTLGPSTPANLIIRGVGMNDFNNGLEAPVTAYSDEFYLMSPSTVDFLLLDLERAEVLRGPQGTLFGRNSTGGLFQFISAKPTPEFQAKAWLSYAEFGEWKAEAVVSGPLSEKMRGRLSIVGVEGGEGFQTNTNPGVPNGDQRQTWGLRAQLEWDISEKLLARFKYEHSEVDSILPGWEHRSSFVDPETGLELPVPEDVDVYGTGPGNDLFGFRGDGVANRIHSGDIGTIESDTDLALLTLAWEAESFTLTSITGYMDYGKDNFDGDIDGNPVTGITALGLGDKNEFGTPYHTDHFTQEIRLHGSTAATDWAAGFYYLSQNQADTAGRMNLYGAQDFVELGLLNQPFPLRGRWNFDQDATSIALFGHVEFDLSERTRLIVGGRAGRESKEFFQDYQLSDPFDFLGIGAPADFISLPPYPYEGKLDETLYSGKLQLDWRPGDDHLLYASISRGQKVGGFNNGQVPFILEEEVQFDSEKLMAYEIGLKSTFGGGRTRLNIAAFYYDYQDFQTYAFKGLGSVIGNNDATLAGGEIELSSMPVGNLELSLGVSILDSKLDNVFNGVLVRDTEMAYAPDYSVNGLVRYTWNIGSGALTAQLDFVTSDERWAEVINHPTLLLPSFTRANGRMSYVPRDGGWGLAVWVRNLTNEEHKLVGYPLAETFGMTELLSANPRQVGVTLDFRF